MKVAPLPGETERAENPQTRSLFPKLDIYRDISFRSAAMNMALDEALVETARVPSIRFYQWDHPALSFGYFSKLIDVARYESEHDLVRRWTGGGIVFHGQDLTYSIVIPANDPAFEKSSRTIYENVHRAIRDALMTTGVRAALASPGRDAVRQCQSGQRLAVDSSDGPRIAQQDVPTDQCFVNPVWADVMLNGRKIAGAAQRRTRMGLLQQGSIQRIEVGLQFGDRLAGHLASAVEDRPIDQRIFDRARELARRKYGTLNWLKRR